jgi:hypothetical protein
MSARFRLLYVAVLSVAGWSQVAAADALSQAEQEAQQRSADYVSGSDVQRDLLLYRAHYLDDDFWKGIWQQGGASSVNWYQQLRLLKVHLEQSQQRLIDSTNWIATASELLGADSKPVTIQRQRVYLAYLYAGRIDTSTEQSASLQGVLQQLQTDWLGRPQTTDPSGNYLQRDFDILHLSTPDASSYQIAHGGNGAPDSSLFNLLITDDEASMATSNLDTTVSTGLEIPEIDLSTPSYSAAATNMTAYIIRPDTSSRPDNPVAQVSRIYSDSSTSPPRLRNQALAALFSDLAVGRFQRGAGGQEVYVFTRPVRHSNAYRRALGNYAAVAATLAHYYQVMIDQLQVQLQEAYQRDQEMLGLVASYRAERDKQLPIATVISTAQAQQIFQAQVGNTSLSDIPLISIAAYALWAYVGPPWANISCWPTTFGCIPNPLYYTITAQLVRGLETTSGMVYTGTQQAMNALKNEAQEAEAISFIQDLETKKADLQTKEDEYEKAYGSGSYRVRLNQTSSSASSLPVLAGKLSPITEAAMLAAQQARRNSTNLVNQNQVFYDALTGEQTLLERSGLRNTQEANKTRALNEFRETLNARQSLRAAQRNEEAQRQQMQEQLNRAHNQVPDDGR